MTNSVSLSEYTIHRTLYINKHIQYGVYGYVNGKIWKNTSCAYKEAVPMAYVRLRNQHISKTEQIQFYKYTLTQDCVWC